MDQKHSAFGIASLVIASVIAALMFLTLLAAGVLHNLHPNGPYPAQKLIGLAIILLGALDLVPVGLGVVSCLQRDRKRILGVIGLILSSLTALGTFALFLLGLLLTLLHR